MQRVRPGRLPEPSAGGRFFAIPFDAIAGFEEVAAAARALATLPTNIDLDHYLAPDAARDERRSWLLSAPDVRRMSENERRYRDNARLARQVRRMKQTRGMAPARHEWRLGTANCFYRSPSPRIAPLRRAMDRFFAGACRCIGDQFYPPGAFRGWHSDQFGAIGWVVFLVEVAQPGRSSFRYVDPLSGELVVVPDRNDIAYFFRVSAEEPLFWHGVLCESTYRWSQGFSLPDDWRSRVGC